MPRLRPFVDRSDEPKLVRESDDGSGKALFDTCRCRSLCLQPCGKQAGNFYLGRHNEATFENSTVNRLHHVVLPNFLGWIGIDRPPSFRPPRAYSAITTPEVGSGVYDHVLSACDCGLAMTD